MSWFPEDDDEESNITEEHIARLEASDESDDDEDDDFTRRRTTGHAPKVLEDLPNYSHHISNIGNTSHNAKLQLGGMFDEHGRPQIALSTEISPSVDHPFWFPMQVAEWMVHRMLKGDQLWPQNIKNNPYLYYWLGKKKKYILDDLMLILSLALAPILFLVVGIGMEYMGYNNIFLIDFSVPALISIGLVAGISFRFARSLMEDFSNPSTCAEFLMTRLNAADLTYGYLARLLSPLILGTIISVAVSFVVAIAGILAYIFLGKVLNLTANFPIGNGVSVILWLCMLYGFFILSLSIGMAVFHRELAGRIKEVPRNDYTGTVKVGPSPYIVIASLVFLALFIKLLPFALLFIFTFQGFFGLVFMVFAYVLLLKQHNTSLCIILYHLKKPLGEFLRLDDYQLEKEQKELEERRTRRVKF